ncbi:hypothetical protein Sste5346_004249 [Sporothrix stenoceras]|uniref:SHSP domain-containing protein n=1 Tax=Sporothrix stenoceras TaxID=5173 RepID=A0ABR3Z9R1_9PEZI
MPFYQRAFFNPAAADNAFTNIFQLINDIDSYQREASPAATPACKPQPAQAQPQRVCKPRHEHHHRRSVGGLNGLFGGVSRPFNPRFDVRETEHTYELHGELAGVDRNNVNLEFTEPQTLVISGNVERNYSTASPAAVAAPAATAVPEAIADTHSEFDEDNILPDGARTPADEDEPFTEIDAPRSPSPARSHRATVTDEATEDALERGEDVTNEKAAAEVADPAESVPEEAETAPQQPAAPTERYWFQERAVGEFKRVFNFPVPVDEASVRASLENGILNVSIPKAKRETRRIVVF